MEIRLLNKEFIYTEEFYHDFLNNTLTGNEDYFSKETIYIKDAPDFPIYLHITDDTEKKNAYHQALETMAEHYLNTNRDIHFNEMFWYSLFCVHKREYLLEMYPEIQDDISKFHNIVLKKFDWENYVYKCILAAQYVTDNIEEDEQEHFYDLIIDNMDLYNYIIKYEIFRNDKFLINILKIIDEKGLSKVLKAKIKGRDDLGKDERVGRRVILELNKMYPVVIAPAMNKEELEEIFMEQLAKYWDMDK